MTVIVCGGGAAGLMGAKSIRNNSMPYDVPALSEELENFDFSLNR